MTEPVETEEQKKALVISHRADNDGHLSAAIAIHYYLGQHYGVDIAMVDHNDDNLDDVYTKAEETEYDVIIVLDFSFPYEGMLRLHKAAIDFVWVDHHQSAIDDLDSRPKVFAGKREVGKAACELAFKLFFPDSAVPYAVHHCGRYDVFDLREKNTVAFEYGMRSLNLDVANPKDFETLIRIVSDDQMCLGILKQGLEVQKSEQLRYAKLAKDNIIEFEFMDLRFIALNTPERGSNLFLSHYNPNKHDAMMVFRFDGKRWTFSVYAFKEGVDVSAVAVAHGGGGHKGAAGFRCDHMPEFLRDLFGVDGDKLKVHSGNLQEQNRQLNLEVERLNRVVRSKNEELETRGFNI